MSRFPATWTADAIAYTQDNLAKIEEALQRPLSAAFTQHLQQRAYEFRWALAQQSEACRIRRARKQYQALLQHLEALDSLFDPRDQRQFLRDWRTAARHTHVPPRTARHLRERLRECDQTIQQLQLMCDVILHNLPRPPTSKPLDMFIRQLMVLYKEETGNEPTSSYDGVTQTGHTPFVQFARACLLPIDPVRCNETALYKTIQRAKRRATK